MSKKHTLEYIKKEVEKVPGYKLLSDTYKDNKTLILVECPKGHRFWPNYHNYSHGSRCPECAGIRSKTKEQAIALVEKINYKILICNDIVKSDDVVELECDIGHKYSTKWHNVTSGRECSVCSNNKASTQESVQRKILEKGYTIEKPIEDFKNARSLVSVKCKEGHVFSCSKKSLVRGQGCPICAGVKLFTFEHVKFEIEKFGYTLLSDCYKNGKSKMEIKCDKGHVYLGCFGDFQQKKRCPHCVPLIKEKECRAIVEKLTGRPSPSTRPLFLKLSKYSKLQLDGQIVDLNLCWEYDGEFHYQKRLGLNNDLFKQQSRDRLKDQLCAHFGVYLIRIPYYTKDKEAFIIANLRLFWQWFVSRPMLNLLEYKPI